MLKDQDGDDEGERGLIRFEHQRIANQQEVSRPIMKQDEGFSHLCLIYVSGVRVLLSRGQFNSYKTVS